MDIGRHFRRYFRNVAQLLLVLGRKARHALLELLEADLEERHSLTQIVVQLPGNSGPLLLLCGDQTSGHGKERLFRQLPIRDVLNRAPEVERMTAAIPAAVNFASKPNSCSV